MAPEVLTGSSYGVASDVFSLGVILWQLVTLKDPWEGQNPYSVLNTVAHEHGRLPLPGPDEVTPPLPELPEVCGIIKACFETDPAARPSCAEVAARLEDVIAKIKLRGAQERERPPV
mmetsp:Transcript_25490/g.80687  ORF Transcript_25490/g.80687 Transcript_25490/m.80687 type:complete len:117 (+) Transcript_25490:1029-1379(+)